MSQTHVWTAWAAHATALLKHAPEAALPVLEAALRDADPTRVKAEEWGQVLIALVESRPYVKSASVRLFDQTLERWVAAADPWRRFADQGMGWTALHVAIHHLDAAAARALLNAPGAPPAETLSQVVAHRPPRAWEFLCEDSTAQGMSCEPVPYEHPAREKMGVHPGVATLSAWGAAVAMSAYSDSSTKAVALVDVFLDKGVDANSPASAAGLPALALAAHPAMVARLLAAGARWERGPHPAQTAEAWAAAPMRSVTERVALLEAWADHPPERPDPAVGEGVLEGFAFALDVVSGTHKQDIEKAWVTAIKAAGQLAKRWGKPALAPLARGRTWPGLIAEKLVRHGLGSNDPQLPAALQPSQWIPRLGTGWAPTLEDAAWAIALEASTSQQHMGRRHLARLIGNEWPRHGQATARLLLEPGDDPAVKARIAKALVDIARFDDRRALGWAPAVGQVLALAYASGESDLWFESPWHSKHIRAGFPGLCERLLGELFHTHETGEPVDLLHAAALALAAHRPEHAVHAAAQLKPQVHHVDALKRWRGSTHLKPIVTAWAVEALTDSLPVATPSRRPRM